MMAVVGCHRVRYSWFVVKSLWFQLILLMLDERMEAIHYKTQLVELIE